MTGYVLTSHHGYSPWVIGGVMPGCATPEGLRAIAPTATAPTARTDPPAVAPAHDPRRRHRRGIGPRGGRRCRWGDGPEALGGRAAGHDPADYPRAVPVVRREHVPRHQPRGPRGDDLQ